MSSIGTSQLHRYKPILANVSFVVKFIRERHHVLAKFNEFRKRFHISRNLVMTVPTRWYTQYNSCKTLIQAKFAVTSLLEEEALLHAIQRQGPVTKFKESGLWSIYSFIHSKRRNRLGIQKVEKLVFIYINHQGQVKINSLMN